jgi:hypothetical protein
MAAQEHSPETRNPEPLRKLAHPIGLSKRLTIGATLSFVNRKRPSVTKKFPCGSELARESGGSANKEGERYAAFASKLAPTEVGGGCGI